MVANITPNFAGIITCHDYLHLFTEFKQNLDDVLKRQYIKY